MAKPLYKFLPAFYLFSFTFNLLPCEAQVYKAIITNIRFFSEAPIENIEAVNEKSISFINTQTMEIVFQVPIKEFKFDKSLMEEHFNENYMESEKYPHSNFSGKITGDIDFTKDGTYDAIATGILKIHGLNRERTLKGTITIQEGKISIDTKFDLRLTDHDIDIPKIVIKNIAEVVEVTMKAQYEKKENK